MKKKIQEIARANGCTASYSGKDKTMWITGENASKVVQLTSAIYTSFSVKVTPKEE